MTHGTLRCVCASLRVRALMPARGPCALTLTVLLSRLRSLLPPFPLPQLELATMFSAMAYAMFLFHIQHEFEGTYRGPRGDLVRTAAIARGSSYLYMPWWWRWASLGVEHHAIHHMNARVPCYRLQVRGAR
jgi:fatty acid desaturase